MSLILSVQNANIYENNSMFAEHLSELITYSEKYFEKDNLNKITKIQDPSQTTALTEVTIAEEENLLEFYLFGSK